MQKIQTVGIFTYGVAIPSGDGYRVNESLGRLVDGIAEGHQKVIGVFAVPDGQGLNAFKNNQSVQYTYKIKSQNARLETIPLAKSNKPARLLISAIGRFISLYKLVKQCDFAYIFVPGSMGLTVAMLCVMLRKPFGAYFGADWLENARFRADWGTCGKLWLHAYKSFARFAERFIARKAAFVLVTGRAYLPRLRSYNPNTHETVLMSNFNKTDLLGDDSCRVEHDKKIILFVGPVTERKGVIYLVKALPLLEKYGVKTEDVQLWLVGALHNDYWSSIVESAKSGGLMHLIKTFGYISNKNELLKLYRSANVFVVPSLAEGFPRVIYEAMAQRIPVIATSIASIKETLGDSGAVQFVTPEDSDSIAKEIAKIINDQGHRQNMVLKGMEIACNKLGGDPSSQVSGLIARI